VSNLNPLRTGSTVVLTWLASSTSGASYHVYRANSALADSWSRLTSSPTSNLSFTNTLVPSGTHYYLVRAVSLKTRGIGSYYDLSQSARTHSVVP